MHADSTTGICNGMEDLGLPASQSPSGEADNQPQSSFRPVLQDPARQIRLFKIEDTKDDPEDERQAIRLSMNTFDLAHAPEYTATEWVPF